MKLIKLVDGKEVESIPKVDIPSHRVSYQLVPQTTEDQKVIEGLHEIITLCGYSGVKVIPNNVKSSVDLSFHVMYLPHTENTLEA